jgi:hypothetical protein
MMYGPQIVARTLSELRVPDKKYGNRWQYNPRSDKHSKIACWAILFDLMRHCQLLAQHVELGRVGFGINHEMRDFKTGRKKDLDLVICTPGTPKASGKKPKSFLSLGEKYGIKLSDEERSEMHRLPPFGETPVGEVQLALEAKACMTAHGKAGPRLYDELSSSHLTIHGSSNFAIAVGFVMVNVSERFISPTSNPFSVSERIPEYNTHKQPSDTEKIIDKVGEIQRRSDTAETGFDAIGLIGVSCVNDGSPVIAVSAPPAPGPGDLLHYDAMIRKIANLYQSRFPHR